MPELPDLEAIKDFLNRNVLGLEIGAVEVPQPLVIRRPPPSEFVSLLEGNAFREVGRRGKYLLLTLRTGHILAINFMLSGRLQFCGPGHKRRAKTCFILSLEGKQELRYYDGKFMGKVYLLPEKGLGLIPGFDDMGPEALDEALTLEVFQKRLRRHPGQIKNILANDRFLAGIGNAYADEILFEAGIYPFRPRPSLSPAEIKTLYEAMHSVLKEAIPIVAQRMKDRLDVEVRDFLKVHGKGGQPCPCCGNTISQITANQKLTNFCRRCQK
jgi:formamidopyrimidine-DNA glycosylase